MTWGDGVTGWRDDRAAAWRGDGVTGCRGDGVTGRRGDGETGRQRDGVMGWRGHWVTGRRGNRATGRQREWVTGWWVDRPTGWPADRVTRWCMLQLTCHLPARAVGYPWRLIYSSDKHGFSLQTLYRFMAAVESPVLLLIKDSNDRVRSGVAPPRPRTPPPPLPRVPAPPLPSPVEKSPLPTGDPGSRIAIGRARPFLVRSGVARWHHIHIVVLTSYFSYVLFRWWWWAVALGLPERLVRSVCWRWRHLCAGVRGDAVGGAESERPFLRHRRVVPLHLLPRIQGENLFFAIVYRFTRCSPVIRYLLNYFISRSSDSTCRRSYRLPALLRLSFVSVEFSQ